METISSSAAWNRAVCWSGLHRVLLTSVCSYIGSVRELLLLARVHRIYHAALAADSAVSPGNSCWAQCGLTVRMTNGAVLLFDARDEQPLVTLSLKSNSDWAQLEERLLKLRHLPAYRLEWQAGVEQHIAYARWIEVTQNFLLVSTALTQLTLAELSCPPRIDAIQYSLCPISQLRHLRSLDLSALQPLSFMPMAPLLRTICQSRLLRLAVSAGLLEQLCLNATELPSIVWLDLVARTSVQFKDWPALPFPSLRFLSLLRCPHIGTWTAASRSEAVWTGLQHLRCHIQASREVAGVPTPPPAPPLLPNLRSLFLDLPGRQADPGIAIMMGEASQHSIYKWRLQAEAAALLTSMPSLSCLTVRGFTFGFSLTVGLLNLLPGLTYLHLDQSCFLYNDDFLYQLLQRSSPLSCRPRLTHLCLELPFMLLERAIVLFSRKLFPSLTACHIQTRDVSLPNQVRTVTEANELMRAKVADIWVSLDSFTSERVDVQWLQQQRLQVGQAG